MKILALKITRTKIVTFMLLGFFIWGCSNNEKVIIDRLELLTENYFNSTNKRPNVDSLKSRQISDEVYNELSNNNRNSKIIKLLNSDDSKDSLKLIDLIYDFSFPIAYNSRHSTINDTTQIHFLDSIKDFYNPSIQNYRDVEDLLIEAVKNAPYQDYWSILDTLTIRNYYRQYSFYRKTNNDSMVYINALCGILESPVDSCGNYIWKPMDWRNEHIIVHDGGDCYWQILINLTKKTVEHFSTNGEA
jgi:hypothetical protein